MKKKIAAIVIACVLMLSVGGYFVYRYVLPSKEFSLEFSEYYQGAEDFEELEPLLNQYFGAVQAAYDKSDKENLETFLLDSSYEAVVLILKEKSDFISDRTSDLFSMSDTEKNAHVAALGLCRLFLKIEVLISQKELLLAGNQFGFSHNPEWFDELETNLSDIYSEYKNGNGEL